MRNLQNRLRQHPIARDTRMLMRRLDGARRALPDFVIIGAQKSGTSSLHRYLVQHPDIQAAIRKEVHFFDGGVDPGVDAFARGENWYRAHFPARSALAPGQLCFEASPLYMFDPRVAGRMAGILPDAKLIAVLRDPATRALSHYFHSVRDGRESRPLRQALEEEDATLDALEQAGDFDNQRFREVSYKRRGLYHAQLSRFHEHFPAERILVVKAEDLFAHTADTVRDVLAFLGKVPTQTIEDLGPQNVGANSGAIDPDILAGLRDHFAEPNQALYRLLGRDLGW